MSRSKRIVVTLFITFTLTISLNFFIKRYYRVDNVDEFITSYMPNTMGVAVYEVVSPNRMKCNLTTVNFIIGNMITEGFYYIVQEYSTDTLLDIVLSNGEESHRILYNRKTRDFLSVAKPFSKSYIPQTYISE